MPKCPEVTVEFASAHRERSLKNIVGVIVCIWQGFGANIWNGGRGTVDWGRWTVQQQFIHLLFILHGVSFLFFLQSFLMCYSSDRSSFIQSFFFLHFLFFFTRNVLPKNESAKVPQCVLWEHKAYGGVLEALWGWGENWPFVCHIWPILPLPVQTHYKLQP